MRRDEHSIYYRVPRLAKGRQAGIRNSLFKDKRPIGVIIRDNYINRALRKVEKNKDLTN